MVLNIYGYGISKSVNIQIKIAAEGTRLQPNNPLPNGVPALRNEVKEQVSGFMESRDSFYAHCA